jgi:hypothetical protein
MGWIHDEPEPAFESTATQAFALSQRLSSCMAENAALREQAMRRQLTSVEREALIVASIEMNALGMFETNHSASIRDILARLS